MALPIHTCSVYSLYLKAKVHPKLLLSQNKFSGSRKFILRYQQFEISLSAKVYAKINFMELLLTQDCSSSSFYVEALHQIELPTAMPRIVEGIE